MNTHISATPNKILMQNARESLKGKWGISIATMIIIILTSALQYIPYIGWLIFVIIIGPISVGLAYFILKISRNEEPKLEQIFSILQNSNRMGPAIGAYILSTLFIILGYICLIVPGIILGFALSLIYFILADDSQIGAFDAIKKSYHLMKGNKWKFACLGFRFIGWVLLSCCTCGIGFLWLGPYMWVAYANFYKDIITKNIGETQPLDGSLKVDNL